MTFHITPADTYALRIYFELYGFLAISHILIQMGLGHAEHRRQNHQKFIDAHKGYEPKVSVIVPTYREDPDVLVACVDSIVAQDYQKLQVIVVDDGTPDKERFLPFLRKYEHDKRFTYALLTKNMGKRHAQKAGFEGADGDIIVTVDSDTILREKYAISEVVKRFKNEEVAAVTGDVRVENKNTNFLTRLISYRYWMAFNQERAAQSYFSVLMCCSGPFSAYRRSVLEKVMGKYVSQRFLGRPCTYGDDRHLTNLMLENGYKVVYDAKAVAYTYVPENLGAYLKQQLRWNKSFYREALWTMKNVHKHNPYLVYDLVVQLILPPMLMFALLVTVVQTLLFGPQYALFYLLTLVGIALLRALYGIYRTHDKGFLSFAVYGFMHVFLLIPVRLYALATLRNTGWGTR